MLYANMGIRKDNNTPTSNSGPSKGDLEILTARFEKLKLVNMALWTFIKEKFEITEEQLVERYKEVDMIDGSADGKIKVGIKKCTKCGKTLNPKFEKCQYCGTIVSFGTIFEGI
ncbi:MAG: hypothetical protein PF638_02895 [Candidatus Delongbacteria bacterium]|jgi:hypothetical protein|nr:hypothetical protein [Candidatus Delongbacteria bacterium]